MIMSSTPATIETPGATAITAHISMMAPTLVQGAHQPGQSKMFGRRLVPHADRNCTPTRPVRTGLPRRSLADCGAIDGRELGPLA